jgi:PAS domain S-box-containing protein/putative nucleotidyltransferase with HDIG domain
MFEINNKYNVLCVDDNANNLFSLNALLQTVNNIKNIDVLSGQEALNVLLKENIDIILLDIQMPEMNGFELAKLIKSNKKTKEIPIIFVTAVFKSEEFIKEGFSLGAIDYITKPIDDQQLLNKITLYLKVFDEKNKVVQSEKRFYDIAQSVGDGIYTLDTNKKTTFINNQALSMLGYSYEELINKEIHNYINYKDIDNKPILSIKSKIHKTMIDGEIFRSNDEYLIRKDRSFMPVSVVATPLYENSIIVGTVVSFTDKTYMQMINNLTKEKLKNQEQVLHSMIEMIESRDSYTAGHTKRVATYCVLIAKEMGYDNINIELLKNAAWLHDIGKISTPDSILLKPSKLNKEEYSLIQEHLTSGYKMLSNVDQYKSIAEIMGQHHEKFNGKGYPKGLKHEQINPLSRIMIVSDAFDAMTTNRIYKAKKSITEAIEELKSLSGIDFHPEVVEAAVKVLKNVNIDDNISQMPSNGLEKQRFSYFYKDRLTDLFLIDYLYLLLRYQNILNSSYFYAINLHNFSKYNKQLSWEKGDEFLIEFSNFLKTKYPETTIFRIEGDDFLILSEVKINKINDDLKEFILFDKSLVTYSCEEKFVENLNLKI